MECDCSGSGQWGGRKDGKGRGDEKDGKVWGGERMYTAGERGCCKRKDSIVCEMSLRAYVKVLM